MFNIFNQIFILFLILFIGIIIKRFKAVGKDFNKYLVDFIMNVTLPALIISSMNFEFSLDMLSKSGVLLFVCAAVYLVSIIAALIIPRILRIEGPKRKVYQFMIIFSNVGFMGYPVINAVYGQEGVFYTAIYNLPFNLLLWTVGLIIMGSGREDSKITLKTLFNPGTISVFIGFLIFMFSIKIPGPILSVLDMVGSMTTPLSMILVGFILGDYSVKKVFSSFMVFNMSLIRLVAMPMAFFTMLKPFIADPLLLGIPVVISSMPAAANTVMFAGKYEGDTYTASQSVFISTLLSIITIPLVVYLIGAA